MTMSQQHGLGVVADFRTSESDGNGKQDYVMLPVAQAKLQCGQITSASVRALCDSGAQMNLVSQRLVAREHLHVERCSASVIGINRAEPMNVNRRLKAYIVTKDNGRVGTLHDFLVIPNEMLIPESTIDFPLSCIPESVRFNLADINFNEPQSVEIIFGAAVMAEILQEKMINLSHHHLRECSGQLQNRSCNDVYESLSAL